MVWIHGGGFIYGSRDKFLYGPLKKVQEHIEVFGGDKNNVIIFGESAGAASVHYLSLSPLADDAKIDLVLREKHHSGVLVGLQRVSSLSTDNDMSGYIVQLDGLGRLRGVVEKSFDGESYLAFKGIPYAKPPLGALRFADPVSPEPWTGIREAAEFGDACAQYDLFRNEYYGSEDCLYLNVYVPSVERNSSRKFPVMVWFHGGGFFFGSGDNFIYGPDYLMKKEVILITINYRLGVFGFLNLEHRVAPGNQGLKDQVFALRWIQKYIEAFGGDKNNVTIFGESAGGASVHYLSLSPLAKGLFHKAIAQSGLGSSPWASVQQNPKSYVIRILEYFGKSFANEQDILDFLKTVECDTLKEAETKVQTQQERVRMNFFFGPGPDDVADEPFFPNFKASIENEVIKVPLILGYNDNESFFVVNSLNEDNCKALNDVGLSWALHPNMVDIIKRHYNSTPADLERVFFDNEPFDPKKSLTRFVELHNDLYFINAIHNMAQIQARNSDQPTYLYKFTFDNGGSSLKNLLNLSHMPGAGHMDELMYLFYGHGYSARGMVLPGKVPKERIVIERLTKMWTDFAKTGNPIPAESEFIKTTWKPIKAADELHYLEIGEELSPGLNPDAARRLRWNKLPNKF